MRGSFVRDMPEGAQCEQDGREIDCNFYLQDEWQDPLNHETSVIYKYPGESMEFRIHWVDGPEAREVGLQDGWQHACDHHPKMYSVAHHGDGDRLRHIVCEQADPVDVKRATNETIERFDE